MSASAAAGGEEGKRGDDEDSNESLGPVDPDTDDEALTARLSYYGKLVQLVVPWIENDGITEGCPRHLLKELCGTGALERDAGVDTTINADVDTTIKKKKKRSTPTSTRRSTPTST